MLGSLFLLYEARLCKLHCDASRRLEGEPGIRSKWNSYFEWGHMQDESGAPIDPSNHTLDEFFDVLRKRFIVGSPDDVIQEAERYQKELGITEVVFQMQLPGLEHEKVSESIRLIGEKVIPYFADQNK